MKRKLAATRHLEKGPLPDVPWLHGMFVRAPQDAVAARYRGEMASCARDPFWAGRLHSEVTGEAARIDAPLGPEINPYWSDDQKREARAFAVRGHARVSRVRCNPDWTFVERPWPENGEQYMFDDWLGAESLLVWSGRKDGEEGYDDPAARDGFSYHSGGTHRRWVEYNSNIHDGTKFLAQGPIQPFENPDWYADKKRRDRITRARLFEVLEKLAIDPTSVFARRELDNPLLYTSELPGQPCDIYEAERQRYVEITNKPYPG